MFLPSRYKVLWALRVSRYKFYRSRETITVQDIYWEHWRSVAVQFVSKPESCHGAEFKLSADERVRVQLPLLICLGSRSKSKNRDKQLTFIDRVSVSFGFYL